MDTFDPQPGDIDLGGGHRLRFYQWAPDDLPENRKQYGYPLPNVEKAGAMWFHPRKDDPGSQCIGSVRFNVPGTELLDAGRARWTVESWEPLTLAPSILCRECGRHGFVLQGRWVEA